MTLFEAIGLLCFVLLFSWLYWLVFTHLDSIWAISLHAAKATGELIRDLFFHGSAR